MKPPGMIRIGFLGILLAAWGWLSPEMTALILVGIAVTAGFLRRWRWRLAGTLVPGTAMLALKTSRGNWAIFRENLVAIAILMLTLVGIAVVVRGASGSWYRRRVPR